MAARKKKTLKELILELLKSPMSVDDLIKAVKSKRPRTRVRVIKTLVTRLKKDNVVKDMNGKLQAS
ncbi:hypothetical protein MJ1_0631 [Nanobdella aerobiophila]|uniref:Uncharacterized protein n=1 Tax=Nanobdella aerobiophila TaxID=2586965 RepID=A0A915SCY9_9ARCH|nr:hypothetical protein [Nanobdella aerobiophila]BBL45778.1 hypothetical protein MJ1_0631 [Nanobdella aerobiophila]